MSTGERRREPRIQSRGPVQLLANGLQRIPGTILDVSISGISVDAEAALSPETPVKIDCGDFIAEGIVRYCRRQGQRYCIGIALPL